MNAATQNVIVLLIVAAATSWLAYRTYATLARKRKAGCGACANCPTEGSAPGAQTSGPQFVSLEFPGSSGAPRSAKSPPGV